MGEKEFAGEQEARGGTCLWGFALEITPSPLPSSDRTIYMKYPLLIRLKQGPEAFSTKVLSMLPGSITTMVWVSLYWNHSFWIEIEDGQLYTVLDPKLSFPTSKQSDWAGNTLPHFLPTRALLRRGKDFLSAGVLDRGHSSGWACSVGESWLPFAE